MPSISSRDVVCPYKLSHHSVADTIGAPKLIITKQQPPAVKDILTARQLQRMQDYYFKANNISNAKAGKFTNLFFKFSLLCM